MHAAKISDENHTTGLTSMMHEVSDAPKLWLTIM